MSVLTLDGSQSLSGGFVFPSPCLETGWVPESVWRLGGSQCLSGGWVGSSPSLESCGEEKKLSFLQQMGPQLLCRPASSLVAMSSKLFQFNNNNNNNMLLCINPSGRFRFRIC
jgi:hypothetical protein